MRLSKRLWGKWVCLEKTLEQKKEKLKDLFFSDFDNFSWTSADVKVMSEKQEWCLGACLWQHILYVEYCITHTLSAGINCMELWRSHCLCATQPIRWLLWVREIVPEKCCGSAMPSALCCGSYVRVHYVPTSALHSWSWIELWLCSSSNYHHFCCSSSLIMSCILLHKSFPLDGRQNVPIAQ